MSRAIIAHLDEDTPFPHPNLALGTPNGLLAAGADLSPERLLSAYRQGIFPWFSEGEPILWWSPNPRMVLYPREFEPSRSLKKTLRKGRYRVLMDTAFEEVMAGCAAPREGQGGTWISPKMQSAYQNLFQQGLAHSFETWLDDTLVGGLYGVAIGQVFCGESMFSRVPDASKIAFAHMVDVLMQKNFQLIDCQMHTAHLASLHAREISRQTFLEELKRLAHGPDHRGPWTMPLPEGS